MNKSHQPRHIHYHNALRAANRHVKPRLVRRNGHAKGLRGVALKLVQRNFNRAAHLRSEHRQRVRECAAVFQMRQRDKVLGMVFGHHAQTTVG